MRSAALSLTSRLAWISFLAGLLLTVAPQPVQADPEREKFFETRIRPLLAERCFECHGEKKQQGELRLDRRQSVFGENPAGPLVVPGKPEESRIWQVLQYDEFDVQMPPEGQLPEPERELLRQWIEQGAYWPQASGERESPDEVAHEGIPRHPDGSIDFSRAVRQHWAYRPVEPPTNHRETHISRSPDAQTGIDRFLLARLEGEGLTFSEPADRRTLIRRLSFDLHGLPPSFEAVQEFIQDDAPDAWERLVDEFLSSPRYGERWGRYWLDVARYADTKGYVFTENKFYPYAYTYRDYVISAFNDDVPYDRFVIEQLAADQLGLDEHDPRLAALGFLTVGPRFLNRLPDIIDDRIDVVTRGLMGMTLACSRCHDHKYDPLPTADYYSLYGVFDSCYEPDLPPLLGAVDESAPGYAEFKQELEKRQQELDEYKRTAHAELLDRVTAHAADYLPAAAREMGVISKETEIAWEHGEPRTRIREHWQRFIESRLERDDPVFRPWKRLMEIPEAELAARAGEMLSTLNGDEEIPAPLVAAFEENPPQSRLDVARTYGRVFASIAEETGEGDQSETGSSAGPELHALLSGPGSVTDVDPGNASPLFERDNRQQITNLKRKVDEWRATSPGAPPRSMVLLDKEQPAEPVVFVRGNPGRRGDRVPRRFPQILDEAPDSRFTEGSGRLELARQIVSPENPLTARVIVNRVWMHHFGTGLVATPSDFGTRGEPPTHPELLDALAWRFMREMDWSRKALHREILLSQAYRQASLDREEARWVDPENRLYWRQNRRRLDFEAMRDALLQTAGLLDLTIGGRPFDLEQEPFIWRRTVYGLIDRNNLPGLLRTFDFPSPDSSSPNRPLTTVPQQALFGMNSPFSQAVSQALAERVRAASDDPGKQAETLIRTAYARSATDREREQLTTYLKEHRLEELAQALLMTNEFLFVD